MTVLAVAPHVDVIVVGERGLVATTPAGYEVFSGAEYASVVRAVDGTRTEADVVEAAASPRVAEAVAELRAAGVLVEADEALPPEAAAFWTVDGVAPRRVAERLASASVAVETVGTADGSAVRRLLEDASVAVADDAGLTLVLTDDYLSEELRELNQRALDSGRPWMLATTEGVESWVGPVFAPDRGPCWECLAQRLRLHRPLDAHLREAGDGGRTPMRGRGSLPAARDAIAGVVATTLLRWIVLDQASGLTESVLSIDKRLWRTGSHALAWRPQCPACGEPRPPERAVAQPIALAGPGERPALPGTWRTVAAETTLERFVHHVSPITGAVNRLVRIAGARPPLHAYLAGDPGPQRHGDERGWSPRTPTPAGGKGTTDEQARASALCEALERYSGRFGGEEPRRAASFAELGDDAVYPNAIMGFSDAQYATRESTNASSHSMRTFVPTPFDPDATVDWTPVWSLSAERERLVPTALCYYDAPVAGREACLADSNGNAAGNTIEEAILQGLLELVERDHVALWWFNRLRMPGVDLRAIADPWLAQLQARFEEDERELWALDLTADLGIPVVAAVATRPGDPEGSVSFGFGAHLDLGLAVQRAAAELVQLSSGVASAGLGHGAPDPVRVADADYVTPGSAATRPAAAAPSGDLRIDVDVCRELVEARGLEVMVLDQTRADIGLPVVKVLVPGLRHFWPRFASGRLYDVPVALGFLDAPLPEEHLNPVPPTA